LISLKNIGPGTVIAAAFIGPGTITMCSIAGTMYGLDLMWALLFSLIMTTVLQLTAAKIGLITQKGLSSNLLDSFDNLVFKYLALALVLSAILIGNTAYEAGNISGGVLGVSSIFGKLSYSYNGFIINLYSLLVGLLAISWLIGFCDFIYWKQKVNREGFNWSSINNEPSVFNFSNNCKT